MIQVVLFVKAELTIVFFLVISVEVKTIFELIISILIRLIVFEERALMICSIVIDFILHCLKMMVILDRFGRRLELVLCLKVIILAVYYMRILVTTFKVMALNY